MDQKAVTRGRTWVWGYPASVAAHALILALVIFGLPVPAFEPAPEEVVEVAVVPPPEEPVPEEPTPPEPAPEPEAPKPEAQQAPPPQPASPSAAATDAAEAQRIAALRPVVQFGETDAGPRQAQDGNAATDEPEEGTEQEAELPEAAAEPEPELPEEASAAAESPDELLRAPNGAAIPVPTPAPRASGQPVKAKRLLSPAATGALAATTAIGNLPRGRRAGELCATELREQLRHGVPAYRPELLPTYELDTGTVLDVRQSAFRTGSDWYNLSFTCKIDGDATRVVSFALAVGDPVPRSEWRVRGFPEI